MRKWYFMEKQTIPMVFTINKNYEREKNILKIRKIMSTSKSGFREAV